MDVTAVLLNWKRPGNLPGIVESLRALPQVRDIWIWDNSGDNSLDIPGVQFAASGNNIYTYGRFLLAILYAETDWIITQDDDWQCDNWPEILADAEMHQDQITVAMDAGHIKYQETHRSWPEYNIWEVLLGWGSAFRRDLVAPTFKPYISRYGEDELLCRKADRLFTLLLRRRHNVMLSKGENLAGAMGPDALYRQKDHYDLNQEAARRAIDIARSG